ncbi:ABC transporter [Gluconobacter oxydans]|uniref:ABC transporter ATP-binding protein n=1 Tax=Gluconobacter thailandicus TaxID=257438 RepID=UPI00029975ED|nr:ABC transporter ATP-binding protein [Gluconobacter thailandicus]AFW02432.1 ABC transporter-like protein [Gluconobacter oxydans H24]ANQ42060.1 ABC transporter [Gluconobacter oxydans]
MPDVILRAEGLGYDGALALADLSVRAGEHIAVIGPNGAGKSTLLKLLAGLLTPSHGQVTLAGKPVKSFSRREMARQVAWLSQSDDVACEFLVSDYIALGRLPFQGRATPAEDKAAIRSAVEHCGVGSLITRVMGSLSGGERQRVMLARCLAQTPRILLLDEPTNHLDLAARSELLALLRTLPITILAVLHDLSLVPDFAARTVLLSDGHLTMDGLSQQVLLSTMFEETFRLKVHQITLDDGHASLLFRPATS